jgi:hypothetical protein
VLEGLYFIITFEQVLEGLCFYYIITGVGGPVEFECYFIMELESDLFVSWRIVCVRAVVPWRF